MIIKTQEDTLPWKDFKVLMDGMEIAVSEYNQEELRLLLIKTVPGFKP
jgi:hypothetical protein